MEKNQTPGQRIWLRPQDRVTFRTSDPKKMLGMYLPHNVYKTYTKELVDADTGEVKTIEHRELLYRAGTKLTKDVISQIMFNIQAEEITDVEVSSEKVIPAKLYISQIRMAYVVVLNTNITDYKFVVEAQTIEQAIRIAMDFGNVYRDISGDVMPLKVNPLGCSIIFDDDDCIPEEEQLDPAEPKPYYKVSVRLTWYNQDDSKWEKDDRVFIITADEVGQARSRVSTFAEDLWKDQLRVYRDCHYKIRKVVPFEIDALVPEEYSRMYKEKETA